MKPLGRIGSRGRATLLVAAGVVAGGGAYAVANVPDDSGVIHGCVSRSDQPPAPITGQPQDLRIIDPSAGQACDTGGHFIGVYEVPLDWNFKGPTGPRGLPGIVNHDVTIQRPPVKSGGGYVAQGTLGSGRNALKFPVLETDFSPTHVGGGGTGSGGGTGKVAVHEFTITKIHDKASPLLFKSALNGKHFANGTITLQRKAGKPQQPYLVIKMTDVIIASYKPTGHGGDTGQPQESLTLAFAKVKFEYKPQKPDGTL